MFNEEEKKEEIIYNNEEDEKESINLNDISDDIEYMNILDNMIVEFGYKDYIEPNPVSNIQYYELVSKLMIDKYKDAEQSKRFYKKASAIFLIVILILFVAIEVIELCLWN